MSSLEPNGYEEKGLFRLIHDVYVYLDHSDRLILEKFNLTPTQFRLISLINSTKGQRLTTLSDRLLRSKSQVTRVIDILEENNIVRRSIDPKDRRAQHVVLTRSGESLREKISKEHQKSLEALFSILNNDEQYALTHMLDKLKQGMTYFLDSE